MARAWVAASRVADSDIALAAVNAALTPETPTTRVAMPAAATAAAAGNRASVPAAWAATEINGNSDPATSATTATFSAVAAVEARLIAMLNPPRFGPMDPNWSRNCANNASRSRSWAWSKVIRM